MALPTTQTTASQPVTGNGSAALVVLDQPDQLVQLLGFEAGQELIVGERGMGEHVGHAFIVRDPDNLRHTSERHTLCP